MDNIKSNEEEELLESAELQKLVAGAKIPMMDFEQKMFVDIFDKDALLIIAKGLNYNTVILNLLWVYNDPGNLVLVVNSSEYEEKYFMEKLKIGPPKTLGIERNWKCKKSKITAYIEDERYKDLLKKFPRQKQQLERLIIGYSVDTMCLPEKEKSYLEGGIHILSTQILVIDLLKNRIPISHITGIIVLRAHTVLESCQEAFALRLYRQKNKTGFVKAFSHSPISFTFGYNQVEKVMRALFVTELFLWPRFHGTIIKCLKRRQAEVEELHIPLTSNSVHIQTCLLDIMNYTVKQLKSINKTLDLQEITTENCITKKFHKVLQSQLDCVWHQLSTRTKEYVQDLKIMRSMIINLIHDDSVSFYALVSKYRTPEYAQVNSGWILLDSAEQLFRLAKGRVFNHKNEFDPEPCPKWKCLNEILLNDIPDDVKKKNGDLNKTKILILCHDKKTCRQLNHYLTMGPSKYLFYSAFRSDVTINSIASKYKNYKDCMASQEKDENEDDDIKSNYVLTLTQIATQCDKKTNDIDESMFEPISQIEDLDMTQLEASRPIVCIQPFKESGNHFSLEKNLETLRPEYIILYHSDVAAVRQIEVYECKKRDEDPICKIFFVMHDKTVEEQAYLTSLKREKQAFELLIQTKGVMVVPTYQDGKTDEYFNMNVEEESSTIDTRKAGGQSQQTEPPLVVVDMREFRSDLPALLHKRGINIEPVVITIGDYILTPDICVERKSIADLIGSLNSGRLYTQCTQMCRNYSRPILLIEFDQNKSFNLQGHLVVSSDMSGALIQQKLQLLTIHFPRLKLVWSPSPYATAELFYELKQGRRNPVVAEAAALSGDKSADDMNYERYNVQVHDLVLKLPGVTTRNIARIMNKGGSLDHLITLSEEELSLILENKNDAKTLYSVLHMTPKPADVLHKEEKGFRSKFKGKYKCKT